MAVATELNRGTVKRAMNTYAAQQAELLVPPASANSAWHFLRPDAEGQARGDLRAQLGLHEPRADSDGEEWEEIAAGDAMDVERRGGPRPVLSDAVVDHYFRLIVDGLPTALRAHVANYTMLNTQWFFLIVIVSERIYRSADVEAFAELLEWERDALAPHYADLPPLDALARRLQAAGRIEADIGPLSDLSMMAQRHRLSGTSPFARMAPLPHGRMTLEVDVVPGEWLAEDNPLANAAPTLALIASIKSLGVATLDEAATMETAAIVWAQPWLPVLQAFATIMREHRIVVDAASPAWSNALAALFEPEAAARSGVETLLVRAGTIVMNAWIVADVYTRAVVDE